MGTLLSFAGSGEAASRPSAGSQSNLKTRPDYAVTRSNALVGFVEVKAPGKGADPRKFRNPHDKEQWKRLQSLPNLIYTDGNAFSIWRNGELAMPIVQLDGDRQSARSLGYWTLSIGRSTSAPSA